MTLEHELIFPTTRTMLEYKLHASERGPRDQEAHGKKASHC